MRPLKDICDIADGLAVIRIAAPVCVVHFFAGLMLNVFCHEAPGGKRPSRGPAMEDLKERDMTGKRKRALFASQWPVCENGRLF